MLVEVFQIVVRFVVFGVGRQSAVEKRREATSDIIISAVSAQLPMCTGRKKKKKSTLNREMQLTGKIFIHSFIHAVTVAFCGVAL